MPVNALARRTRFPIFRHLRRNSHRYVHLRSGANTELLHAGTFASVPSKNEGDLRVQFVRASLFSVQQQRGDIGAKTTNNAVA